MLVIGGVLILFGVFRLIWHNTHNRNNVSLTNWMFTGGLPALLVGFTQGVFSLFKLRLDPNASSILIILSGVFVWYCVL